MKKVSNEFEMPDGTAPSSLQRPCQLKNSFGMKHLRASWAVEPVIGADRAPNVSPLGDSSWHCRAKPLMRRVFFCRRMTTAP
ncbi:hypothetical protein SNE35_28340 [Paucibacter sp. R3-3]|uniref:Uncharacterized protein n=1 Tax=Roseateles agri TaxID=3098619 RepID=A0ABU5DQ32_9BURK|nr:hypothetical protein [Paucibacter sp. R3-3]MDY0748442.1 hypothetical protein [Paucibacter sp. R3-3]